MNVKEHVSMIELMQAEQGQELQVAMEDLTPEERAAFEAELASGALARLVIPWEPWWRSAEAQHLSLSSTGTRLIQEAETGSSGILLQASLASESACDFVVMLVRPWEPWWRSVEARSSSS